MTDAGDGQELRPARPETDVLKGGAGGERGPGGRRTLVVSVITAVLAVAALALSLPALASAPQGPSVSPTGDPSGGPTWNPSGGPTWNPSGGPTWNPSGGPTWNPSGGPTMAPTASPTWNPTGGPSVDQSGMPTWDPTAAPPPRPTAVPTSAGGYCPVHTPSGLILYPTALDPLLGAGTLDSPANRVIVCRYTQSGLAGAADVRDARTVRDLQTAVDRAHRRWDGETCPGAFYESYLIFTDGHDGRFRSIDLTNCFGWLQPSSLLVPGDVSRQLIRLTSGGSGR
jgi:hypothetical protein